MGHANKNEKEFQQDEMTENITQSEVKSVQKIKLTEPDILKDELSSRKQKERIEKEIQRKEKENKTKEENRRQKELKEMYKEIIQKEEKKKKKKKKKRFLGKKKKKKKKK